MGIGRRSWQVGVALACALAALILVPGIASDASDDPVCSDDFNDPGSGWDTGTSLAGTAAYRNGRLEMRMAHRDDVLWSWSPCSSVPDDFVLEVTAHSRPGIDIVSWGAVWGVDDENLLVFLITPTGLATVRSMRNGKWQPPLIDWKESPAIDQGDGVPNTLRVTVEGNWVTVRINNVNLGRFEIGASDDLGFGLLEGADETAPGPVSLADGSDWKVGVAAGAFQQTPVEVEFQSFAICDAP